MKKLVILFSILLLTFAILPMILADEETQVNQAYDCLKNKISTTGCSTMSFEEKVFSLLAVEKCKQEVISEASATQCWPKSSCDLKSTSLSLLALNEDLDTTAGENWLLSQTSTPTGIDWFLEIESPEPTTCTVSYLGASYSFSIGADKKISKNAGICLSLSTGAYKDYFFLVSPVCYNEEFNISCDKSFISTLLFKKQGSDSNPLHVLEEVHSASSGGKTTETIDAKCFSKSGVCNYEGSLWATLTLYYLDYDVSAYMPYLLTLKDDNEKYLPESFLYFITGKLRDELLLKQISNQYWQAASTNSKYYDTALALFPFLYKTSYIFEKENSINWLLDTQDTSGCWDNGNIRNTAFVLYSIWPQYFVPPECVINSDCASNEECINEVCVEIPECDENNPCPSNEECFNGKCIPEQICEVGLDCPQKSCETASCSSNTCFYNYVGNIDNDGCCSPGSTYLTDNDCEQPPECTSDPSDTTCESYNTNSSKYCLNNAVYMNSSIWNCESESCVEKEEIFLIDQCSSSEECSYGNCVEKPVCVYDFECPEIACKVASCSSNACFYNYVGNIDNDGCCSPGSTYLTDNDCEQPPECTSDPSDTTCESYNTNSSKYCYNDDVYLNISSWNCESENCVENETRFLVKDCSFLEECKYGACYFLGGDDCETNDDCADNEFCNEDGICEENETTVLDCEDSNYFCMSKSDCDGNILTNYDCSGLYKCCDTEKTSETCSSQGGDICDIDEACVGGTSADASDTDYGEICCISGTCKTEGDECTYDSDCDSDEECSSGECVTKEGDCGDHDGTCRSSCLDTEEETFFYTCEGSKSCCISSKSTKKNYTWIWILLILILLSALGIVFRDKLRTQWMKLKSKFGKKKSKDKRRPGMFSPLMHPTKPIPRVAPRKIIPTSGNHLQRKPLQRKSLPKKPEEKPSSELDDVLKKLRDLGK